MRSRLNGGRGVDGSVLSLRCFYCDEDWPDSPEFFYYYRGRRHGRKCLACRSERVRRAPLCSTCGAVRTSAPRPRRAWPAECHGCAGRTVGPLTVDMLRQYGMAAA